MQLGISKQDRLLKGAIVFALMAVMLFLSAGDLLADHCGDDCETQCDDSCRDCGDCLQCLPILPMLPGFDARLSVYSSGGAWTIHAIALQEFSPLVYPIDHPPQNALR